MVIKPNKRDKQQHNKSTLKDIYHQRHTKHYNARLMYFLMGYNVCLIYAQMCIYITGKVTNMPLWNRNKEQQVNFSTERDKKT